MFYGEKYKMFLKANISYNNHDVLCMFLHVTSPSARSESVDAHSKYMVRCAMLQATCLSNLRGF